MPNQVHAGQTGGEVILFLPIDGNFTGCLIRCTEQQRTRTTGWVIDSALTRILGKLTHQRLVGIPQNIIATSAVIGKVQLWLLEDLHNAREFVHSALDREVSFFS